MTLEEILERRRRGSQRPIPGTIPRGVNDMFSRIPFEHPLPRARTPGYMPEEEQPIGNWPAPQRPIPRARIGEEFERPMTHQEPLPGGGGLKGAMEAREGRRKRKPPVLGEEKGYRSILDKEVREKHPVASAIVAGVSYGSRAGEVLRARDAGQAQEERQKRIDEEAAEERRRRREAAELPAPEGYFRDAVSGELKPKRRPAPSEEEIDAMAKKGLFWSEATGQYEKPPASAGDVDLWSQEPPKGLKGPPGTQWVPGKGFLQVPKEGGVRTPEQIKRSYRELEAKKGPVRNSAERLKKRRDLLRSSLASLDPDSPEFKERQAQLEEIEDAVSQIEGSVGEYEALQESDIEELQPHLQDFKGAGGQPITWEMYEAMSPEERRVFRFKYRLPKGPRPAPKPVIPNPNP